jgi:hypothetical protein
MPSRARTKHVILVSIDGMLPAYYLDPTWLAPAMQQLYREGAHAVAVRPVFPALTYPGHTTAGYRRAAGASWDLPQQAHRAVGGPAVAEGRESHPRAGVVGRGARERRQDGGGAVAAHVRGGHRLEPAGHLAGRRRRSGRGVARQ